MYLFKGEKKPKKTTEEKNIKKSSSKTRSKSNTKGGNFLGAVGDLVAPTGWGPFVTAAGLLALDRADAALRRGTKEKKEMKGGRECRINSHVLTTIVRAVQFDFYKIYEFSKNKGNNYKNWTRNYFNKTKGFGFDDIMTIYFIDNGDNTFSLKIEGIFYEKEKTQEFSHCLEKPRFENLEKAIDYAKNVNRQKNLGKLLVKEYARTRNPPIQLPTDFFELRNYSKANS